MKKLIAILTVFIVLTGCANKSSSLISSDNSNLKLVTGRDGIMGTTIAYNRDGRYRIDINSDGTSNIMYTDFASGVDTYLCGRPECTHDDESCTSYISSSLGGNMLFLAQDKIYIYHQGLPQREQGQNDSAKTYLETMDLNGENRSRILTIPSNESIWGAIAADENNLYFMYDKAFENEQEEIYISRHLVKYNISTGEMSNITEIPDGFYYLIGCAGDCLIIKNFEDASMNSKANLILVDIETGEKVTAFSWKDDSVSGNIYNNKFVYIDKKDNFAVKMFDFEKDEVKTVSKDRLKLSKNATVRSVGIFDNKFIFRVKSADDGIIGQYAVDLENGEMIEINTTYVDTFGDTVVMPILCETEDKFLIVCSEGEKEIFVKVNENEGYNSSVSFFTYALIGKDDYWNSNLEYTTISQLN